MKKKTAYKITHFYDIGNQEVYIQSHSEIDVIKAAVYCQFKAEEWFDNSIVLSNLAIASLLITFYDCTHHFLVDDANVIDMGVDREKFCGTGLCDDNSYDRDKLKEFIEPHSIAYFKHGA